MSSFICERCGAEIWDSPFGYLTGCPHYPLEPAVAKRRSAAPDTGQRESLIKRIEEIDQAKRKIRLDIQAASNRAKAERTSIDQDWLHRAKGKIYHLDRERAEVRQRLVELNKSIKDFRRKRGGLDPSDIALEFLYTARERLGPELYEELEDLAAMSAAIKRGGETGCRDAFARRQAGAARW